MATGSDLLAGWLQSGGQVSSPEAITNPSEGVELSNDSSEEGSSSSERTESSDSLSSLLDNPGSNLKDSSKEQPLDSAKSEEQKISDKEVITVTDETGKKKIEIDYGDREAIKKAHSLAHGSRKWQAQAAQAMQREKAQTERADKLQNSFNALQEAFDSQGVAGVIDLLEGRHGAHKDYIQKQLERERFLERASPEEKELLQARERELERDRELTKIKKSYEELNERIANEKREAEFLAFQSSAFNPVFDKYRFDGKLGDEEAEHELDDLLFNASLSRLKPYEDKGIPLTRDLVEREIKKVADRLNSQINKQSDKKAAKVIEQKKREATENVQAKVLSGYKSEGIREEAANKIKNGDMSGILKNWGKYKNVFDR